MAADIQAQLRDEVKKKLTQLIDEGMDPAQVRAMVPQLQAKVAERYQAYETEQATKREKLVASNQRLGAKIQQIEGESVSDQQLPGADPAKAEALRKAFRMPNELSDEELAAAPYDVFVAQERNQRAFRNAPTREKVAMQTEAMVGNLLGAGAGKAVGKAVSGVTKPLISKGVELVGNALGGGASAGAGRAAGNVVSDEREWHEGVGDSMQTGAILGGAATAAGQLGQGVSAATRRADPWIDKYARNKAQGEYGPDSPHVKGRGGVEGIHDATAEATNRIVRRMGEKDAAASAAYQEAVPPMLKRPVERDRIRAPLRFAQRDNINPDTGEPINKRVNKKFEEAIEGTGGNPTVEGTLMRRRALKKEAAFDSPAPTPEQQAAQDVYAAYRAGVRAASPEVAAADDAFTARARDAARERDIVFNTQDEVVANNGSLPERQVVGDAADDAPAVDDPKMRVAKEQKARTTLGRRGDTNVPGLKVAGYLDELAARDPEFAKSLEYIEAKKAYEGSRFGLSNPLPGGLSDSVAQLPIIGGPMKLAAQNSRAIGARIVEPGGRAVGELAPMGSTLAPHMERLKRAREKDKERAAKAREARGRK